MSLICLRAFGILVFSPSAIFAVLGTHLRVCVAPFSIRPILSSTLYLIRYYVPECKAFIATRSPLESTCSMSLIGFPLFIVFIAFLV